MEPVLEALFDISAEGAVVYAKDYAREEVRQAIDVLASLEPPPIPPPTPTSTQPPAPPVPPLLSVAPSKQPPTPSIPTQIALLTLTLSHKKTLLAQLAGLLDTASKRLKVTLGNETRFYQDVAVGQLRRQNWVLHSKEERGGRGIYVEYGLGKAGSTSSEICEAYFTWSSSSAATTDTSTPPSSSDANPNKITLKFSHGKPRLVTLSMATTATSASLGTEYILPNGRTYNKDTKIQKALSAAKAYAFETEVFRE
ncbi:hypothetical protein HDU98_003592, partial [Podochytrium sp. JEL0797]